MYYTNGKLKPPVGINWWQLEIGVPQHLEELCIYIYEDLPKEKLEVYMEAVDMFANSPTHASGGTASANGMWMASNVALRAILLSNPPLTDAQKADERYQSPSIKNLDKLSAAKLKIESLINFVSGGEVNGFHTDGSHIDHSYYSSNGGYGISFANYVTKAVSLFANSDYSIDQSKMDIVMAWVRNSYETVVYRTNLMDMTRGRDVGRYGSPSQKIGFSYYTLLVSMVDILEDPEDLAFVKRHIKYYTQEFARAYGSIESVYSGLSIPYIAVVQSIMDDDTIEAEKDYVTHKQFPTISKVTHYRPDFGLGVSMYGNKTLNYEDGGEFKNGWNSSNGMLYIYTDDTYQFDGNYWPTVDANRLPGATAIYGAWGLGQGSSNANQATYVGGTALGDYGTAGMILQPTGLTLSAKKSYFMFDNEVVALGSDISATGDKMVETTLENRKLKEDLSNQFFVDGAQVENGTKENAKWAYLEGNTEKSGIGYYFPEGETVKFKRETNSGRWSDINSILSSSELHTNSFQQLYIEHGKTVTDGDYAYIILPASDKEKTQAYAEAPNITILEKSKNIHAVKHNQLGMIAANVFVDGPADIGGMITIDKASSIMTQETADTFAISVSDPTQNSNAKATVTVNVAVDATPISSDSRISNISVEGNKLTFTVNFAQSAGQGAVLVMKKTADASIEAESDFCGYEEGIIDFGGWTVNYNGMNIDTNTVKEGAQSLMLSGTGAVTYTQQDAKKNITFYFYPETGNSASVRAEDGNGAYIELGNKNGRYYIATDERTLENDVPIVENQWNKITIDSTSGEFTKMMVETSVTAIHYGMDSVSKLIFGSEGDGGKAYIDNVNVRTFKPSVSNVSLTQTERVFAADYLFTDYSGANEGNSIIAWSVSGDGETFETIPGATGKTLEITDEQVEHWFKVSVTPVNAAGVTGETVTSAAVQETKLSSPKIRNLSMVSAAGADGLTTHTVTYEYVAPELGSAAGEAEGETSVVWYIGDSADGPFTQIADAKEYTVTKEQIKKYLKVVIVPKTINGVSGGEYSVVKQDTTSLAPIFNEADTEKKMKAVIDQYAGVLGYGDRLAALPEVDVELFVKLMMKQYASDDEITSALEYAYTTSAQGDPIIYKVLETAGFESGSWTVDSGKTALKEKENPLAREGNRLAETSGSTTDTGVYKFENMGRYKYIMYFYDSGGAGAVALMEITCGNTTLMLTFRPDQSKGYYTTRVKQGDPFVSTGIMRSEGWHRVEWDYSDEKNLTILLDGAVAYDSKNTSEKDTYIGNPSQIRVGNIWGSGVGGSDSSLTWFDALSVLEYNVVPTIKDVSITQNKERLTANGSFEDVSGAKEGNHDYQWYVADMENGEYTKISGATSRTLNLTKDDVAKYFKVEITPKNADGRQGVPVMSGVYQENYLQTLAPSVTNVRVSGTPTQNNTVSAEYTYQQGTSGLPEYEEKARYSWYVSDTENGTYVKIAGADKKEYTFTVADAMKYFKVGVSVVEKEGETEEGRVSPIVFSAPVRNTSDVLWVVRNADATQLKELFPSYVDGLGLSSKFAGLSETTILNIYRGIAKKSYASESDLKKAIDEIISGISTKPGTGGSSGGGTGGGSGGGTGGAGGGNSSNDSSLFIEPQPSVPVKENFTDLGTAEWAREAIEYLSEKEYVKGKAAGLFAPDDNVTRAEFVTILMRSMELSLEDPTGAFDDVAVTDWFYPYVAKAAGLGLVKGKDEKHFCPDDFITREEMAVLVYRFAVYTERQFETGETAAFADAAHIADYAKEAVEVLSANGIINGIGGGYFDPQGVSTRAMAAQMVYRIIIK